MSGEQLGSSGEGGYRSALPDIDGMGEADMADFLKTPEGETAISGVCAGPDTVIATTWQQDGTMQSEDLPQSGQQS